MKDKSVVQEADKKVELRQELDTGQVGVGTGFACGKAADASRSAPTSQGNLSWDR